MARSGDHRTRVTKMLIHKAFTDLVRVAPIQSISIKALCERAGINRGTFYAHYTDLYDLRDKMEAEMLGDFERALEPILEAEGGADTLLTITTGIFQCIKDNAGLCAVTLGANGDKEFAARIFDIGREKCLDTYSVLYPEASRKQLEYFYAFVSAGCTGILEKWLADGMRTPVDEMARISQGLMTQGVNWLRPCER